MTSQPRNVRFGVQARVLLLALGVSLPALIIVGWLSLNGISQARLAAVKQSENTLLIQAENMLMSRAIDKAELYDQALLSVQRQVQTMVNITQQAFSRPLDRLADTRPDPFWLAGSGPTLIPPDQLRLTVARARQITGALQSNVDLNPLISLGYLATKEGVMVLDDVRVVSVLPDGFDARKRPWYQAAEKATGPTWVGTYVDAVTNQLNITVSAPVKVNNQLIGVIGMDLLLTTIQSDVLRIDAGSSGYAFVMDHDGNILIRPELEAGNTRWDETFKKQNLFESNDPNFASLRENIRNNMAGVTRLQLDGGDRYLAYSPMRTVGWVVALVLPIDDVISPARNASLAIEREQEQLRRNFLAVLLITSGLIIILATGLARTIIRPLRDLEVGAQRIASGQLDQELVVHGNDEIGRLSLSFNQMTTALREKVDALEVNAQQMAAINETSNELKRLRSLNTVLDHIPQLLCQRLGFDRAVLYLLRDEVIEVVSASFGPNNYELEYDFMRAALSEPITIDSDTIEASVIKSRQAVIVDNPWEHPQVIQAKQFISGGDSYVQAPILGREKVLGLISADYYEQGRLVTVQDAALLLNFADMVGLTIENAFSFQNLEDLVAQRTGELREALDRAQAADRLKSQFLASISHELRTPLNAIIGFSTVLLDELSPLLVEEQREDLETINKNGRYLLDLINDILDMARIEAGKFALHREATAVLPVVQSAVDIMHGLNSKPVTMRIDIAPDLPPMDVDPTRLRQIVINLISNAVKFTDRGQIVVRAIRRVVQEATPIGSHYLLPGDWIVISVQDTGIGMDAEALGKLFQEFQQVHAGARGILGSGLGLSITRRLVDLHDGDLWVDSKVGVGSTFSFAIATASIPAPIEQQSPS